MRALARSLELGADFWDTANVYGDGLCEIADRQVPGRGPGRRSKVTLSPNSRSAAGPTASRFFDNSAAHVREALEGSLKRLGVDRVDLYYVHRVDKSIPIEDTVGELARLVKAGRSARSASPKRARHAPPSSRRAPDRSRPVGIFPLDAQSRTRPHPGLRGSGRDSGRLLAARTRVFQRPSARRRAFGARISATQPALPERQLATKPRPPRRVS